MKKSVKTMRRQKARENFSAKSKPARTKQRGQAPLSGRVWKKFLPHLADLERQIKTEYHIAEYFPEPVEQKARALQELSLAEKKRLVDLRDLTFVTIDGEDARDFDDAIAVEKNGQGFRLLVAIADVSHYVPKARQSRSLSLDSEALARGNSFYFPSSVAPMLPPRLSTDLASLKPDKDRAVMVCELLLSQSGDVQKAGFSQALIRSQARLTYSQVKGLLLQPDPEVQRQIAALPRGDAIIRSLDCALTLCEILKSQRKRRGSLILHTAEPAYRLDEHGEISNLGFLNHHEGHSLIEECMLLANEACAKHLAQSGLPFLYRTHARPAPEQLEQLKTALSLCPGALPANIAQRPLLPEDLPNILLACQGQTIERAVTALCLRALPKALYSTENIGHFGLALPSYCHFTSPIRRYADLLVHRALKHSLGNEQFLLAHKRLQIVASHLNRQEERALRCQREMHKYCSLLYMRKFLGQEFWAVVGSVTQAGFFVELTDLPVSGFVARRLLNDTMRVDLSRQKLFNPRTGQSYQFGDTLRVRLLSVVPQQLAINFLPLQSAGFAKKPRTR
ncbi:MAG: VacB/RNase II family 3'-5' exoribonuclease [Desulfovibrio sp.]|nr:VacB/RNase II family 3'-5' exoribonuclease [Desulfovibrio sp.]